MRSLSDLQEELGALHTRITMCVDYIAELTGNGTRRRGPYRKNGNGKANGKATGAALREHIRNHFAANREADKAAADGQTTDAAITVNEAAKLLDMSGSNVRLMARQGKLHASRQDRPDRRGHGMLMLNRDEVLAYANQAGHGGAPTETPTPPKKAKQATGKVAERERRKRTAALLDSLDREEPRHIENPRRVSVLLQHGYIKSKGNGYVRTAKTFTP